MPVGGRNTSVGARGAAARSAHKHVGGLYLQQENAPNDAAQKEIRQQIDALVRKLVPDGEVVVHIDVCVASRVGPDLEEIAFRRFSPAGSDPVYSVMMLGILRNRLKHQLLKRPVRKK